MEKNVLLRTANDNDLPAIVAIYNQAVAEQFCTGDTEPVTVQSRLDWFHQHTADSYPIYIAEDEGRVVGWCSLSPYRPGRTALRTTAEISYYIDASHRRRGVGDRLVKHAILEAPALGFTHLLAVLMDVNAASLSLLEKNRFQKWGHLPEIARFGSAVCGQFIYGREI